MLKFTQLASIGAETPVPGLPDLEASALIRLPLPLGQGGQGGVAWDGGPGHCHHTSCSPQVPLCLGAASWFGSWGGVEVGGGGYHGREVL